MAGSGHRAAPRSAGLIGESLAALGQVALAGGLLDMRQQGRALAHVRPPAPPPVARGPPAGGIGIGLGPPPATQERRDRRGVNLTALGLAPRDRLHGARVAQGNGKPFLGAGVGEPVPGGETFNSHDHALTRGPHDPAQGVRLGV
jgi:hypothetical protein